MTSYSHAENKFLQTCPKGVKHGFILAKAVRLGSIARPEGNLEKRFSLNEEIDIDGTVGGHHRLGDFLARALRRHEGAAQRAHAPGVRHRSRKGRGRGTGHGRLNDGMIDAKKILQLGVRPHEAGSARVFGRLSRATVRARKQERV